VDWLAEASALCVADPDGTPESVARTVEEARSFALESPTTLVVSSGNSRVTLTKLPLCRKPGRALAPVASTAVTAELARASVKAGARPEVSICVREPGLAAPEGTVTVKWAVNGAKAKSAKVKVTAGDLGLVGFRVPVAIAASKGSVAIDVTYRSRSGGKGVAARARYVPGASARFAGDGTIGVGEKPKIKVSVGGAGVARVSGKITVSLRAADTGELVSTTVKKVKKPGREVAMWVVLPAVKVAGQYDATISYGGNAQVASVLVRGGAGGTLSQRLTVTDG
jgi:hypothetical protein